MIDENLSNQLRQLLQSARTIFIIFPRQANNDQKAVAASLYLAAIRAQKAAVLVSPEKPKVEEQPVAGLEFTQQELGNQNLSISFPYAPEQVDKVSYHIGEETKRFFLSIKPKPGVPPLDASQVEFSYTGASADAVILVGVKDLESLEQLYYGYEQLYQEVPSISLNTYTTSFGTHVVDVGSLSSISEAAVELIAIAGWTLDSDIATNLLNGIEANTKNFSSPTTSADTFEVVAQLLRAGARRSFKRAHPDQLLPVQSRQLQGESDQGREIATEVLLQSVDDQKSSVDAVRNKLSKSKAAKSKKDSVAPPDNYVPKRLM